MNCINIFKLLLTLCMTGYSCIGFAQNKKASFKIHNIAFYNIENLFDTMDDPNKNDADFLPEGSYAWTEKRYQDKLERMASMIVKIGADKSQQPPTVIGISEVENLKCLQDLIATAPLNQYSYEAILIEGPDKRGIDVGLLYRKDLFDFEKSEAKELWFEGTYEGFATRNQLIVEGTLEGEKIAFLVNHWPSRGAKSWYREQAGALQRNIIDSLRQENPTMHIVSMGDYNDDPTNKSIQKSLGAVGDKKDLNAKNFLYNPMYAMHHNGVGTLAYRDNWNLFDQIIISKELVEKKEGLRFYKAEICNYEQLKQQSGRYKGYPFRTYVAGGYIGGYSDHFPVVVYLVKQQ